MWRPLLSPPLPFRTANAEDSVRRGARTEVSEFTTANGKKPSFTGFCDRKHEGMRTILLLGQLPLSQLTKVLTAITPWPPSPDAGSLRTFSRVMGQLLSMLLLYHQGIRKIISSTGGLMVIGLSVRPTKTGTVTIRSMESSRHIWHASIPCNFLNLLPCRSSGELSADERNNFLF